MTLDFMKNEIEHEERYSCKPFIGYISPNGKLVDYRNPLEIETGDHFSWKNPTSFLFLACISYVIKDTKSTECDTKYNLSKKCVQYNSYPGIEEIVKRGGLSYEYRYNLDSIDEFVKQIDDLIKEREAYLKNGFSAENEHFKMEYDLLFFFKKAYKNKLFFDSIGRTIEVENHEKVIQRMLQKYSFNFMFTENEAYRRYLKRELMQYFKDICIQYLGYDSIERFKPDASLVTIPRFNYCDYDDNAFLKRPRIITSSAPNTNERFYNYLLMDWAVHKLPRYRYNNENGKYEKEPEFCSLYNNEKEEILGKEIASIKKLVPIDKRYKYFR